MRKERGKMRKGERKNEEGVEERVGGDGKR